MKKLDINKKYIKLWQFSRYDYYEVYFDRYLDRFYWFDKKTYSFIHNENIKNIDNLDKNRYVRFIWFDECDMIDFYIDFCNDDRVREYLSADDEYKCLRMEFFLRKNFFYLNSSVLNEFGEYNEYLVLTDKVVKWCEENDINYVFERKAPPKRYEALRQSYLQHKWVIPTNDIEFIYKCYHYRDWYSSFNY